LSGVGHGDLTSLIRVQPHATLTALRDGSRKASLKLQRRLMREI
jgi:hypothetical protein